MDLPSMNFPKALTESRVREVLKAIPILLREAKHLRKSGRDHFLAVSRLPDIDRQETIVDVVSSQLDQAFGESVTEAGSLIRDYYRVMEIYSYIRRGGIATERARLEIMCTETYWESMVTRMPRPEMVHDKISMMRANAEMALKRLKLISAAEEAAVAACKAEIEKVAGLKVGVDQIKRKRKRHK